MGGYIILLLQYGSFKEKWIVEDDPLTLRSWQIMITSTVDDMGHIDHDGRRNDAIEKALNLILRGEK